ncbi:uncharacterized protein LACBIDRAFT_300292 [Laccaria bicolor S238N-H82]|uniref:Predicted protein n=1 Tax=Laccaria bicolor (strain S238N-H82 / ATCC MYA-4686) TaxID=486041 RepID=B0DGE9_LACBS|nr:uncharacterized protein LACBIDRAFT_300292 [Laccaria bicolor S238N-H82]EDR06140.1 predicted protein [Laccaria bicolor S238N-H82]|eukprot:XP_001883001.1 predicted protein [Laccaria bicolor S238N-H82]
MHQSSKPCANLNGSDIAGCEQTCSGWNFDAVGASAFRDLRKLTLRAEDDDGFADMVRTVLEQNENTLKHLILGGGVQ